jgi:hypothetical protein
MTLKELMNSAEIHPFEVTELEVARWARQGRINQRAIKGRKKYDINEVMGCAFALSGGWALEEIDEESAIFDCDDESCCGHCGDDDLQ